MEILIPELQDIVNSYCSPYHEICSQERDTKEKLKSMGIDYKTPIYNTSFLEALIECKKYDELLHGATGTAISSSVIGRFGRKRHTPTVAGRSMTVPLSLSKAAPP